MKYLLPFLLVLGFGSHAQELVCPPRDREIFEEKIQQIKQLPQSDYGSKIVAVGQTFTGTEYVANTLDLGLEEPLVINLSGLDCTTFVENVLVLTRLSQEEKSTFENYLDLLENLRYRDGVRNGYASRLHYFSEWLANNEKKGWLRNISTELGGIGLDKDLDFMSTHRDSYLQLKSDENLEAIRQIEGSLSDPLCVVSQDSLAANEHLLRSGDIVALATRIKGLDVTHTGLLVRLANGRIHLLHASTKGGVEISDLPLVDYLKNISHNIGVLVARPEPF